MPRSRVAAFPAFLMAALALSVPAGRADAQEAIRTPIEWHVLTAGDFEVHYPAEAFLPRAREVAAWLLAAQPRIEKELDHDLEPRIRVILYRSKLEAGQHEAGDENAGQLFPILAGVRKRRIIVPLEASNRSLQRTLEFQLAQIAVQQRLFGRTSLVASIYEYKSSLYPAWVTLGIAASQAGPLEPVEEMLIRDAVLDRALPSLTTLHSEDHLSRHFRYPMLVQARMAVDWISRETARGSPKRLMHVFDSDLPFPTTRHIERACGVSYSDVEIRFSRDLEARFRPEGEREEADGYSRRLGRREQYDRHYELGAVLSPDGRRAAWFEDSAGYFDLVVVDTATGEETRPLRLILHVALDELHPRLRGVDWSPDGRSLCFVADRSAEPVLCLLSLDSGLRTVSLHLDDMASPQWSPDGRQIVLVGQRHGYADLYRIDVASGRAKPLTEDALPESDPAWSPDGRWIACAVESGGQTDLWRISVEDGRRERLTDTPHDETGPTWRPDGAGITFSSDPDRIPNLYSMALDGGGLTRHTDVPGGAFAPRWSADGTSIVFTVFRHGRFEARLMAPRGAVAPVPPADPARAAIARRYTVAAVEVFEVLPYEAKIRLESVLPTSASLSDVLLRHRFGVDIRYRFRSEGHDIGVEATYTNRILRPDLFIRARANHETDDDETEVILGAEAGATLPIEAYTRVGASLFFRRIDRSGLEEDDPDPEGTTFESGINLGISRRNITRRRENPIGGYAVSAGMTWLTPALGSDLERTTYSLEGKLYVELFHDVVFASRVGFVHATGPDAENLNLKDRVRGYGSRNARGQDVAWLNAELRFPLWRDVAWVDPVQIAILKDIRASVFADVGAISAEENVWFMLTAPVREEWHYSVGATLQFDIYVLQRAYIPVILSVAHVLDDTENAPKGLKLEVLFELAF